MSWASYSNMKAHTNPSKPILPEADSMKGRRGDMKVLKGIITNTLIGQSPPVEGVIESTAPEDEKSATDLLKFEKQSERVQMPKARSEESVKTKR